MISTYGSQTLTSGPGGVANTDEILATVIGQGINVADVSIPNSEPVAISQPKKAFKLWLGVGVEDRLYPQTTWLGGAGQLGDNAAHSYAGVVTIPPRFCSPLVIWDWLSIRPIEWGFVGPSPTINLKNEIRSHPPNNRMGWYADIGSSVYAAKTISDSPMELVVYGAQAINAICQYLRRAAAAAPALSHRVAAWSQSPAIVSWDPPAADAANEHTYVAAIFGFQPCTIMSYNYATQEVYAPAIIGVGNLAATDIFALRMMAGNAPIDTVGVPIGRIEPSTGGFRLKGVLARQIGAVKLAPAAGQPPAAAPAPEVAPAVNPI